MRVLLITGTYVTIESQTITVEASTEFLGVSLDRFFSTRGLSSAPLLKCDHQNIYICIDQLSSSFYLISWGAVEPSPAYAMKLAETPKSLALPARRRAPPVRFIEGLTQSASAYWNGISFVEYGWSSTRAKRRRGPSGSLFEC